MTRPRRRVTVRSEAHETVERATPHHPEQGGEPTRPETPLRTARPPKPRPPNRSASPQPRNEQPIEPPEPTGRRRYPRGGGRGAPSTLPPSEQSAEAESKRQPTEPRGRSFRREQGGTPTEGERQPTEPRGRSFRHERSGAPGESERQPTEPRGRFFRRERSGAPGEGERQPTEPRGRFFRRERSGAPGEGERQPTEPRGRFFRRERGEALSEQGEAREAPYRQRSIDTRNPIDTRRRSIQHTRSTYRPRPATDGIVAKSQDGTFGESWWARRWIDVLESFGFGSRLTQGQSYARTGAVLSIDVSEGRVLAKVQGSRPLPYRVSIAVIPLSNAQWERAIDAMADQAIFTARLLAGEMPREIEQVFATAGVSLFPQSVYDLQTDCTCSDFANPCKHVAAVCYLLGEQFDLDPFLAFTLRGRSKERIIQALRARRADTAGSETLSTEAAGRVPSLDEQLEQFDRLGPEWEQIKPQISAPAVASTMLRRYGPSPADTTMDLHTLYLLMSRATLERLFSEE